MDRFYLLLILSVLTQTSTSQEFVEVSKNVGINHAFVVDLATFGGGAAVLDYDNDGFEDIYLTGGNVSDALYRNNGDGTFTNTFEGAGFDRTRLLHTQGVAAADVDRDGDKDLLVTTMYTIDTRELTPNLLYLNNGDGTFTDATTEFGLDGFLSNSLGPSFGDINADGFPDLYVANYFAASPVGVSIFNDQTITNNYASAFDFLFLNASGEKFIDATNLYGMLHDGFGFQGTFTDFDNDQDADLLIANDFGFKDTPNVAYRNNAPLTTFTDRSNSLRLNFGMNAMGIAAGDYNGDGWMDYFVTNISASLFAINQGGTSFANGGAQTGLARTLITNPEYTGVPVSWGANFFDFDHDGDSDLFVNNGALNPTIRANHNFFFEFRNDTFVETSFELGLDDPRIGRGSVTFDYDCDGDMDLLVVNQAPRDPTDVLPQARCLLYRNDASKGHWIQIQLQGVQAEKNGIGSKIELETDGRLLVREIDGGSSHLSQNSTIAHFGLGEDEIIEKITVKWLGGNTQEITSIPADQYITIQERVAAPTPAAQITVTPSSFSDRLRIKYRIPRDSPVTINLYNAHGQLMQKLLEKKLSTRSGFWEWNDANKLIPGIYFVALMTEDEVVSTKCIKI